MAIYLVKFILCSGLLLLAYRLLLKNKTTYQFNRAYLLMSLIFSLAVPFLSVRQTAPLFKPVRPFTERLEIAPTDEAPIARAFYPQQASGHLAIVSPLVKTNYTLFIITGLYGLVTLILLGRFTRNIITIKLSVNKNEKLRYRHAWLVLIDEQLTPHTFLQYIFINRAEYMGKQVEHEVLDHELTHARQLHSADVIFVELLQIFLWFNPLIIFYRKAVQLNHEFIADAAVLKENNNVPGYQHLLLEKIGYSTGLSLSSQFNYSVTKKRLIMMAKNTPKATRIFVRLAIIPVMAFAFVLFCTKIKAQQQQKQKISKLYTREYDTSEIKPPRFIIPDNVRADRAFFPATNEGVTSAILGEYKAIGDKYEKAKNGRVAHPEKITNADKSRLIVIYQQMSIDQQQAQSIGFIKEAPLPPPSDPRVPTQEMLDTWKASNRYEIWLNLEKIKNNSILADYKPSDFYLALIYPAGRTNGKNSPRKYRVIMQTNSYYKAYRAWQAAYKPKTVMIFRYPVQQSNNNSPKTSVPVISK